MDAPRTTMAARYVSVDSANATNVEVPLALALVPLFCCKTEFTTGWEGAQEPPDKCLDQYPRGYRPGGRTFRRTCAWGWRCRLLGHRRDWTTGPLPTCKTRS